MSQVPDAPRPAPRRAGPGAGAVSACRTSASTGPFALACPVPAPAPRSRRCTDGSARGDRGLDRRVRGTGGGPPSGPGLDPRSLGLRPDRSLEGTGRHDRPGQSAPAGPAGNLAGDRPGGGHRRRERSADRPRARRRRGRLPHGTRRPETRSPLLPGGRPFRWASSLCRPGSPAGSGCGARSRASAAIPTRRPISWSSRSNRTSSSRRGSTPAVFFPMPSSRPNTPRAGAPTSCPG
jgi:hypothetical protein